MKTSRWLIGWIAVLVVLVAANLVLSLVRVPKQTAEWGNTEPNQSAVLVERVKDEEERARMERYIEEYQQPLKVVKTITALSGETIDCVDIYTQPALHRPGMEDHQIQLAPPVMPEEFKEQRSASQEADQVPNQLYLLTGDTCPELSVPVRRLTIETLTRFETLEDFFKKEGGRIEPPCGDDGGPAGHEYAHAAMSVDNWGAESVLNVWSDYVEQSDEFALSQIWVVRGADANRETVEAGWQLYPDLYGDWRSHLFIYFTPDNYGAGGCYNLTCGAFVQVDNSVYIGGGFDHYSSVGGEQRVFKLALIKDHAAGHWWLRYGETWVGYWPRNLFDANGLRDQGRIVDFGGEIVNTETDGRHTRTDMGSGHWPYEGFGYATYQRSVRYVDTTYTYQYATGLAESRTDADCYDISLTNSGGSWETYFYFGGSGYNPSCP
jgi:hypothetical protein